MLWLPVVKKYWQHHQLWDGTYDIVDLLDIHEVMGINNDIWATIASGVSSQIPKVPGGR